MVKTSMSKQRPICAAPTAALVFSAMALAVGGSASAAQECLGGGAVVISTGYSIFGSGDGGDGGDFGEPGFEEGDFEVDQFDENEPLFFEVQEVEPFDEVLEENEPVDEGPEVDEPFDEGPGDEFDEEFEGQISEATLSQSFLVQPGYETISGRIRFLSDEWPTYFGSEYNDAYVVRWASEGASGVLLSDNVNSSLWTSGLLGFNGKTEERTYSFDISGLVGQTVSLFFEVRDVGDSIVDSALVIDAITLDGTFNGQPIDPCS